MTLSMNIRLVGVDQLEAKVKDPVRRRTMMWKAVERTLRAIERQAKILAPHPPGKKGYSRGALRSSITVDHPAGKMDGSVGPGLDYGPFVEFGTGKRGADSGVEPFGGYHYGENWPGMDAQPYLVPGMKQAEPAIHEALDALGLDIVRDLAS